MTETRRWLVRAACALTLLDASSAGAESVKNPGVRRALPPQARQLAAAPRPTLLGLRLPAFIAFGVGGLSTSGAVATRLAATSNLSGPDCGASCAGRRSRDLSATSTLLAGIAAAGIGTGIVLLFCAPKEQERGGLVPAFRVRFSGQRAVAGAVWRF